MKSAQFKKKKRHPFGKRFYQSDPVWIRTKDLLLRRQLLYPAELQDQYLLCVSDKSGAKVCIFSELSDYCNISGLPMFSFPYCS
jgi:hypothetical protein